MPTSPLFFFNDTATTEIYTLSLHDALPISEHERRHDPDADRPLTRVAHTVTKQRRLSSRTSRPGAPERARLARVSRSEEHTSELQSPCNLVCRLLLEKKKKKHPPQQPVTQP